MQHKNVFSAEPTKEELEAFCARINPMLNANVRLQVFSDEAWSGPYMMAVQVDDNGQMIEDWSWFVDPTQSVVGRFLFTYAGSIHHHQEGSCDGDDASVIERINALQF